MKFLALSLTTNEYYCEAERHINLAIQADYLILLCEEDVKVFKFWPVCNTCHNEMNKDVIDGT